MKFYNDLREESLEEDIQIDTEAKDNEKIDDSDNETNDYFSTSHSATLNTSNNSSDRQASETNIFPLNQKNQKYHTSYQ